MPSSAVPGARAHARGPRGTGAPRGLLAAATVLGLVALGACSTPDAPDPTPSAATETSGTDPAGTTAEESAEASAPADGALPSGVPSAHFSCALGPEAHYVLLGDQGFPVLDDYFSPEGVEQVLTMARAAEVEDVHELLWTQEDGPQLFVPARSEPLTDGETCSWWLHPTLAGSRCHPGISEQTFALGAWEDQVGPILEDALPRIEAAGGFFLDPSFTIGFDEVAGQNVMSFVTAEATVLSYAVDGTRIT